jgi:O-antigen ligase
MMEKIKNTIQRVFIFKDVIIILPLSILIFRIFFSQRRASVFDVIALAVLLIWRYILNRKPGRLLPKFLIVSVLLYMTSDLIGALLSDNKYWELTELRKYVHVFIGGLLFTTPLENKTRKLLITIFIIAAAVAGFQGIWQYFMIGIRSQGNLSHSILFAETLALASGSAIFMIFFRKDAILNLEIYRLFLLPVILLTLGGILFSGSRGVWIAFGVAMMVPLFMYEHRKALIFFLVSIIALSITFYFSINLRDKATSIITSIYTEDAKGSAGTRLELWKGALLIFKESPILGVGTGNFESSITRLVHEKKLKETPTLVHAHNIFLQALATRGIIGFATLATLFVALIKWGINEIRGHGGMGGYIIIFTTILTIVGGLTEDNLGTTKYLAAYCFTAGLLGSSGLAKEYFKIGDEPNRKTEHGRGNIKNLTDDKTLIKT